MKLSLNLNTHTIWMHSLSHGQEFPLATHILEEVGRDTTMTGLSVAFFLFTS